MRLKLLKPYGVSPIGFILPEVAPPIAEILIQRKIAIIVKTKKKKEQTHGDIETRR